MITLPTLNKSLESLKQFDLDAMERAAVAMEKANIDADELWKKITDIKEQYQDLALARQEIKDGGF